LSRFAENEVVVVVV